MADQRDVTEKGVEHEQPENDARSKRRTSGRVRVPRGSQQLEASQSRTPTPAPEARGESSASASSTPSVKAKLGRPSMLAQQAKRKKVYQVEIAALSHGSTPGQERGTTSGDLEGGVRSGSRSSSKDRSNLAVVEPSSSADHMQDAVPSLVSPTEPDIGIDLDVVEASPPAASTSSLVVPTPPTTFATLSSADQTQDVAPSLGSPTATEADVVVYYSHASEASPPAASTSSSVEPASSTTFASSSSFQIPSHLSLAPIVTSTEIEPTEITSSDLSGYTPSPSSTTKPVKLTIAEMLAKLDSKIVATQQLLPTVHSLHSSFKSNYPYGRHTLTLGADDAIRVPHQKKALAALSTKSSATKSTSSPSPSKQPQTPTRTTSAFARSPSEVRQRSKMGSNELDNELNALDELDMGSPLTSASSSTGSTSEDEEARVSRLAKRRLIVDDDEEDEDTAALSSSQESEGSSYNYESDNASIAANGTKKTKKMKKLGKSAAGVEVIKVKEAVRLSQALTALATKPDDKVSHRRITIVSATKSSLSNTGTGLLAVAGKSESPAMLVDPASSLLVQPIARHAPVAARQPMIAPAALLPEETSARGGGRRKAAVMATAMIKRVIPPVRSKPPKKKKNALRMNEEEEPPNFVVVLYDTSFANIKIHHLASAGDGDLPLPLRPTSFTHSSNGEHATSAYYFSLPTSARTIDGLLIMALQASSQLRSISSADEDWIEQHVLLGLGKGKLRVEVEKGRTSWSVEGGVMRVLDRGEVL